MDNLELAISASEDPDKGGAQGLGEGVRGIHRQLTELLFKHDVRGFTSVGRAFDPSKHEAMAQVASDDIPLNHVADELRRGYMIGDQLFRPAQVLVCMKTAALEAVAESKELPGAEPRKVKKPQGTRSAASRPSWVLHQPEPTEDTTFLVVHSRGSRNVEIGKKLAQDLLVPELLGGVAKTFPNHVLGGLYSGMALDLQGSGVSGLWQRLIESYPDAEGWVEDFFWERVQSEMTGTSYEVAALGHIPKGAFSELAEPTGPSERWGGIVFRNPSLLVSTLVSNNAGALITDIGEASVAYRAGLKVGDTVVKIGPRNIGDASSARRMLTMNAHLKRPVDVSYQRGFGDVRRTQFQPRPGRR